MTEIQTIDSTEKVETTTSALTINISNADLQPMGTALEKALVSSQLELAEAEKKVAKLRVEIGQVAGFLSVIKSQLKG
jgi:hypothetical protein